MVSKGIIRAVREIEEIDISLPIIVRLEGTNSDIGRKILSRTDMNIYIVQDFINAAKLSVIAAKEV